MQVSWHYFACGDSGLLVFLSERDQLEAVAQYDFQGRSERELSFRKGDVLELHEQASTDWWRGSMRGNRGLIPAKYISVPTRSLSARYYNSSSTSLKIGYQFYLVKAVVSYFIFLFITFNGVNGRSLPCKGKAIS